MKEQVSYQIRPAWQQDWQLAMDLAWKTFLKYEAEDYTREGIRNFNDFITDNALFRMFLEGKYPLFVACVKERIVGMITLRNTNHISLLFVDEEFHRQGVGSALLKYVFRYLADELNCTQVTVFAAPYGTEFYHKMGFTDLGPERKRDGILYTPMEKIYKYRNWENGVDYG